VPTAARRVVIAANSSWNIVSFRQGLIRALKADGYEPVVVAPIDSAAGRLKALDVEHIVVDLDRSGLNPFADLRLLLAYRSIFKRLRPIAVLGFTIKPNVYGGFAARTLSIPAVPNISGLGTVFIRRGPLLWAVRHLYRFALKRAAVVFFQNPDDRDLFVQEKLVLPDRTRLLPGSGVDMERFGPVPLPGGPVSFLFIGRLLGDKGVRELAAAAAQLRKERPNVRVRLLGPIDEGNRTAITRGELGQWLEKGLVEYLGETDDVRPFVEESAAIVLPSYREGLPRSLLEGGAMGRPLIATDVPGCREVVEDRVNGFLCEVRNPSSLAKAMKRFVDLPEEQRASMGAASRRKIEAEFSEALVIDFYLELLGELHVSRSLAS
jgi:glycosyltransferase involved in cell wall biosynthesis